MRTLCHFTFLRHSTETTNVSGAFVDPYHGTVILFFFCTIPCDQTEAEQENIPFYLLEIDDIFVHSHREFDKDGRSGLYNIPNRFKFLILFLKCIIVNRF